MKRLALALLLLLTATFATQAEFAGPRRTLLSGACPASVLISSICPQAGFNFQTGTYCIQGSGCVSLSSVISVSRASSHLCQTTTGVWISVPANTACITDQGFLIEEGRTNKSTNYNANPTDTTNVNKSGDAAATLTVVDDTAALLAAGLQNVATSGKVYKLDNSAGTAAAFANVVGPAGNTNAHSLSVYARVVTPQAGNAARFSITVAISVNITTTTYSRVSVSGTPVAGDAIQIRAQQGSIVYFILNQLEEGAFVTSPIIIAGASATRAADIAQLIGPAATAALAAKSAFFQTTLSNNSNTSPGSLLKFSGGANLYGGSATSFRVNNSTNEAVATIGGAGTWAGTVKAAGGFDATSMTAVANGGTLATSANAWVTNTGTVYLGNRSAGDRALNGYMQRFALSPVKGVFDGATTP